VGRATIVQRKHSEGVLYALLQGSLARGTEKEERKDQRSNLSSKYLTVAQDRGKERAWRERKRKGRGDLPTVWYCHAFTGTT